MTSTTSTHLGSARRTAIGLDLTIIVSLALLVRIAWAIIAPKIDPFLIRSPLLGDAASYDRIAKSLMAGAGFIDSSAQPEAFWPPLYPAFLALLYSIGGYSLDFARVVQALLGVVVPVAAYFISLRLFGRRVSYLSAIGLIFYPHLVYFNAWLIAESLFMALMVTALWAIGSVVEKPIVARIALAGVLFGLASLTKPFMLFVMPFLALWLLLASNGRLSRRLMSVAILTVAMVGVILPWTIRNYRLFDQVVLISTNGGYTFLGANNPNAWGGHDEGYPPSIPGLNTAEMENVYYEEAIQWIRSNPDDFAKLLIPKYKRLFSPLSVASYKQDFVIPGRSLVYIIYTAFLLIALLGAIKASPQWKRTGFLYTPIAGVLVSAGLYYGDARYTLPMVPSLVIFAALAINSVYARYKQS